jgi:hypothetical protein
MAFDFRVEGGALRRTNEKYAASGKQQPACADL